MNGNSKVKKLMAGGNKIVSCEFKKARSGFVSLEGEFDNGQKCTVIELFDERVRLEEKDFIGLTIREAQAMHVHECRHADFDSTRSNAV